MIGIGGIGISALARYFLSEGWQVSGSDLSPSDTTKELRNEGVRVFIGHRPSNIKNDVTLVVYNQAIPANNPELKKAKQFSIPTKSYPEAVGELTKRYKTIAVAGAHGKSTTTALVSLILIAAGFDPTVIVGTKLKEFGGKNFRKGKGDWLVLEADEWKASFLNYFPTLAIVTNIDKEHLDFYKNFTNVKKAFEKFKRQCGKVLTSETDPKILAEIKKVLQIPGQHNLYDASCAYAVAKYLGISKTVTLKALGQYSGAWRRMELRGTMELYPKPSTLNPQVYDDYAHHPTEIKATLKAFREWPRPLHRRGSPFGKKAAENSLICVFQAHQAQRLKLLFNDFKTAFKDADKVLILPTYEVAGREEKFDKKYNAEALAKAIGALYVENVQKNLKKILTLITSRYTLNPIVVMMGAGDIVNLTNLLIQ